MRISNKKILSMMKFCEPMAAHTTFRIGGPADIWAQPKDINALSDIVRICRQDNIKIFVFGNGSNILVKDAGIKGCAINLRSDGFRQAVVSGDTVKAGAGLEISGFLNVLGKEGLAGLEFLAGIPATIGGALAMNAAGIGESVEEVTVMDNKRQISQLDRKELIFMYRGSNLEKYIILQARFKLTKSDKKTVSDKIKQTWLQKKAKQELAAPSAGCIFKNPEGNSAGRLIDLSGLKGKTIGAAAVSTKHANFIINTGKASCDDVLSLMDLIQKKVKKDHGIWLEPEIKIL